MASQICNFNFLLWNNSRTCNKANTVMFILLPGFFFKLTPLFTAQLRNRFALPLLACCPGDFFPFLLFDCLVMSNFQIALFAGIWHIYCWALETSSMKIRDIVVHPVYASASLWPLLQFPTQNPTRTLPLWMLLQCPSIWRWRWRFLPAAVAI